MEPLFENEVVIEGNKEMNIFNRYRALLKMKESKYKIIIIGISLILFCLIIIVLCQTLGKKENPVKNEDPLDISSSSSFKNDPYFKNILNFFLLP